MYIYMYLYMYTITTNDYKIVHMKLLAFTYRQFKKNIAASPVSAET